MRAHATGGEQALVHQPFGSGRVTRATTASTCALDMGCASSPAHTVVCPLAASLGLWAGAMSGLAGGGLGGMAQFVEGVGMTVTLRTGHCQRCCG